MLEEAVPSGKEAELESGIMELVSRGRVSRLLGGRRVGRRLAGYLGLAGRKAPRLPVGKGQKAWC